MNERFWNEVAPLQAAGRLEEGTMFGFRCVRAGKAFVAMPGHESDGMVVKLPAARVGELAPGACISRRESVTAAASARLVSSTVTRMAASSGRIEPSGRTMLPPTTGEVGVS